MSVIRPNSISTEMRIKVRKKGQITLPLELRKNWEVSEGSELVLAPEGDHAVIRPVRKTKIKQEAGSLGQADRDEIEVAVLDPELVPQHYFKKYRH